MQDLIKQEQFEIEVLDRLNSGRFLNDLVFGGGTMLRLCFGLDRFSVDLDFWVVRKMSWDKLYSGLREYLSRFYRLRDSANKYYSLVFEISSSDYPRSLKIEIRKEAKKVKTESVIAYSKYSRSQVFLRVVSINSMAESKVEAFLDRKEIRDVYDLEFLWKQGAVFDIPREKLERILKQIELFDRKDYTVKLGSLLEEKQRMYYTKENFKILKAELKKKLEEEELDQINSDRKLLEKFKSGHKNTKERKGKLVG